MLTEAPDGKPHDEGLYCLIFGLAMLVSERDPHLSTPRIAFPSRTATAQTHDTGMRLVGLHRQNLTCTCKYQSADSRLVTSWGYLKFDWTFLDGLTICQQCVNAVMQFILDESVQYVMIM